MLTGKGLAVSKPDFFACLQYCRFGNFRENFIFANSIKRHTSNVKNSRLRQGLPISTDDRVILPFCEAFIFTNFAYAKFRENKVLAKNSEFTVLLQNIQHIIYIHYQLYSTS